MKGLRGRRKSEKRERAIVAPGRRTVGVQKFWKILAREMKSRHFGKKFPNALLILLALSKQTNNVLKTVFGDDEARKHEAKAALIAAYRARKPRAAPKPKSPKKKAKSPKKKRSAELVGGSGDEEDDDDAADDEEDEDDDEKELARWSALRSELLDQHMNDCFVDHLALISQQKVAFPIFCDLYKANVPALVHEGNTEREFSSAKQFQGHLCRMPPGTLRLLMFIRGGLSVYTPTTNEIKAEYDLLYGKKPSTSASAESGGGASSTDMCQMSAQWLSLSKRSDSSSGDKSDDESVDDSDDDDDDGSS